MPLNSSIASIEQDFAANLGKNLLIVLAAENDSLREMRFDPCKIHNLKSTLLQFDERPAEFPGKLCRSFITCMFTMTTGSLSRAGTWITSVGAPRHFAGPERGISLKSEQ